MRQSDINRWRLG